MKAAAKRVPPVAPKRQPYQKHVDELLDQALADTFPASDPPAMLEPAPHSELEVPPPHGRCGVRDS